MKNQIQKIIFTGLLVSIGVILAQFLSVAIPPSQTLFKIGIGYLPLILISILFGPFYGLIAGVTQDLVGFVLWASSQGVFYPGFTLNAMLVGVIPWLIFKYKIFKPKTYKHFNLMIVSIILVVSIALLFDIQLVTTRIPNATDTFSYILVGSSIFATLLVGGFIIYTKPINHNHEFIFIVIVTLMITSLILTPIWVLHLYSVSFWVQLPPRIIKFPFEIILYSILLIRLYDILKNLSNRYSK